MKNKKICILILVSVIMVSIVGCTKNYVTYSSSSQGSQIGYNAIKSTLDLVNVTYYDFFNDELITNRTVDGLYVASNTLNSTEIVFYDLDNDRTIYVSTKLVSSPSSFDLYTNYSKTKFVTYSKK